MRPPRGAALLGALVTITVAAGLASLALRAATTRWAAGSRERAAARSVVAVRGALARMEAQWDPTLQESLAVGRAVARTPSGVTPGMVRADSVMRLGAGLFLATAVASSVGPDGTLLGRATGSRLIRLVGPAFATQATLAGPGPWVIAATATLDSADLVPAGWDTLCPPPGPPVSAVGPLASGSPGRLGPVSLSDLIARGEVQAAGTVPLVAPSFAGGACDRGDPLNWGDPAGGSACAPYLPVIVAQGGTRVVGGMGQGLLIGLGSLVLAGDFHFTGVIVSQGPLAVQDRASVVGLVISSDTVELAGSAQVDFARCVAARVSRAASRPGELGKSGRASWP